MEKIINREIEEDLLYEELKEIYTDFDERALLALIKYFLCSPKELLLEGDSTLIFSAHKELFFKGETGPLFLFKRLKKIGYSPKITV